MSIIPLATNRQLAAMIRQVFAWTPTTAQTEVLEVLSRHADAGIAAGSPVLADAAEVVGCAWRAGWGDDPAVIIPDTG